MRTNTRGNRAQTLAQLIPAVLGTRTYRCARMRSETLKTDRPSSSRPRVFPTRFHRRDLAQPNHRVAVLGNERFGFMEQMIAEFIANGGKINKLPTGASTGITKDEWKRLVRGEGEAVEVPALIDAFVERQAKKPMRLRAGYGEVR